MLDSWVYASIESGEVTETSKVIDVLLPLGENNIHMLDGICFVYITHFA
jgi:hypothetical protein